MPDRVVCRVCASLGPAGRLHIVVTVGIHIRLDGARVFRELVILLAWDAKRW